MRELSLLLAAELGDGHKRHDDLLRHGAPVDEARAPAKWKRLAPRGTQNSMPAFGAGRRFDRAVMGFRRSCPDRGR